MKFLLGRLKDVDLHGLDLASQVAHLGLVDAKEVLSGEERVLVSHSLLLHQACTSQDLWVGVPR
jgi:hypothetical protein